MGRRLVLGVAALAFVLPAGLYTYFNSRPISPEEMARRCREAQPRWQSYQEDIKAFIGAAPVAEWRGRPISAARGGAEVTFQIDGGWADRTAALPVLLRTPTGEVHCSAKATGKGGERVYRFPIEADAAPPWLEIQYPHARDRLVLDAQGAWRAAETP